MSISQVQYSGDWSGGPIDTLSLIDYNDLGFLYHLPNCVTDKTKIGIARAHKLVHSRVRRIESLVVASY